VSFLPLAVALEAGGGGTIPGANFSERPRPLAPCRPCRGSEGGREGKERGKALVLRRFELRYRRRHTSNKVEKKRKGGKEEEERARPPATRRSQLARAVVDLYASPGTMQRGKTGTGGKGGKEEGEGRRCVLKIDKIASRPYSMAVTPTSPEED